MNVNSWVMWHSFEFWVLWLYRTCGHTHMTQWFGWSNTVIWLAWLTATLVIVITWTAAIVIQSTLHSAGLILPTNIQALISNFVQKLIRSTIDLNALVSAGNSSHLFSLLNDNSLCHFQWISLLNGFHMHVLYSHNMWHMLPSEDVIQSTFRQMKCPTHPLHYMLPPCKISTSQMTLRPTYPFSAPKCKKTRYGRDLILYSKKY